MSKDRIEAALQQIAENIDAMLPYVSGMSPYRQRYLDDQIRMYEFLKARAAE
jgi:hypothetical protein